MIDPWSATGIRVCGVDGFDAYRDVLSTSTMEGYLKQETANALMKGTCTRRILSNGCFSNVDSPHESFLGDVGCPLCQLLPSFSKSSNKSPAVEAFGSFEAAFTI